MEIKQNVNIHNRFDVHIDNIETGEHREFVGYNIILNQMWTRLCNGLSYFENIHFGIGTGTPIPEGTSLFSHLGTRQAVTEETIIALPFSSWKRKIVLNPEEFVGFTISEVGIAFGSDVSSLVTHAMLKDSEGNPISITKTSTDVVTIYATVFITFINTLSELKLIGMPNNNQLINYLTGGNAPRGSFGLSTIENPYSPLGTTTSVTWTSDVPNRKRKTDTLRFGITSGNGHVKYLYFANLFSLKLPAPGIFSGQPYTGVNVGSGDGVKKSFMLPSANIRQSSLVIKKNGVVVSDYSINIKNRESNSRIADPASPPSDSSSDNGRGVALTSDGTVMAVVVNWSPYVATYDLVDGAWVKRPNPASLPAGTGYGVALTPDGLIMAVAHENSPYITTYDWDGEAWVKRPNPASLPTGTGRGVALTSDGAVMAVAHSSSPYITTYDWIDGAWVKRPNPASLPMGTANGVALTSDGTVMAVAHDDSPYVTAYDWDGEAWVKRPNPTSLPTNPRHARGVALTHDGTFMAVGYGNPPGVAIYDWDGEAWVKRPDPVSLSTGGGRGVALTPDGAVMAAVHNSSPYIATCRGLPFTQITFDTPPALGDAITADYIVDGVHKTDQYVIDVSFAIQFGEGV